MKNLLIIIVIVVLVGVGLLLLRSPEDTWVCEDGTWIKHGNPSGNAPSEPCQAAPPSGNETGYIERLGGALDQARDLNQSSYTVDISGQGLTTLPTEFFEDKNQIKFFDVSNNSLTGALPAEIRKMSSLETIDASGNKLTGIPAEIGQLAHLRVLNFSRNNIDTFPNEISDLADTLERLDISGNPFRPEQISALESLLPKTEIIR